MVLNDETVICLKNQLTKEEIYSRIIDLYSEDIYKICYLLTKSDEESRNLTVKVFADFYDSFESVIDIDPNNIDSLRKSKQILQHLTCMVLKKIKSH